jgi:hypothetical protein
MRRLLSAFAVISSLGTAGCSPQVSASEGDYSFSFTSNGQHLSASLRGTVELTPDGRDIAALGPDGELSISEGTWLRRLFLGGSRGVILRTARDGTLERQFYISGRRRPYDPQGAAWLANTLPRLLAAGFAAPGRVTQILRSSGPDEVLRVIADLNSDYLRALYFRHLLQHMELSDATLAIALSQAGRDIGSDYQLGRLLQAAAQSHDIDRVREAFFRAAGTIGGDYEHRRVLSAVVDAGMLSDETLGSVLESAAGIGSDYELATLLANLAVRHALNEPLRETYLTIAASLSSSHEHSRALAALVGSQTGAR